MTVRNEDLFYCYSKKLADYIYHQSEIVPLTVAIEPKSGNVFSLFSRSKKLEQVLEQYSKRYDN
ncbi:hypothetical protein [Tenuibacillus multivorans]|uniref:Uncharacterized protein n=1 Tax=Tenuibacillus multivorans TaxID=237069 RepID=A0A1G9XS39_9BACI|nr:hypothetical protein [Tenuibacillus multivorans]GEL75785.1 hypothetical protein TMU01_00200 [Tenuibacillus multivorans]SDM99331.1 hypothetical protein SAMN05216498_1078 [Tenuibacillus multivorans]